MRCATSLTRNLLLAALLLASGPAFSDAALTLPQARMVAAQALEAGDTALAIRLARGLIEADRRDTGAWYLVAAAQMRAGNPRAARAAVTRAYRFARTPAEKTRSAELAARFALQESRPTMAQAWLRRAAIHIDDPEQEQRLAADYAALRRLNPFSFSLRTELRPSDNVNSGSSAVYNVIDGVIAPDYPLASQALSGTVAAVDLNAEYRLRASRTSATTLGGRLYVQRVALSGSAKALAPLAENSDYGSTYAEVSLNHAFAVGAPEKRGTAAVEVALGTSWYAGQRNYGTLQIHAERNWRLGTSGTIQLNGRVEHRFDARRPTDDADGLGLGLFYARKLANGDGLAVSLALRDMEAASINGTYSTASMRTSYALARPVGPAKVTAALGLEYADYPQFRLSGVIPATRREDNSYYGEVSLFFPDFDYAGFAPSLRLRAGKKSSNFSQYTSSEVSLSLGIQSKF